MHAAYKYLFFYSLLIVSMDNLAQLPQRQGTLLPGPIESPGTKVYITNRTNYQFAAGYRMSDGKGIIGVEKVQAPAEKTIGAGAEKQLLLTTESPEIVQIQLSNPLFSGQQLVFSQKVVRSKIHYATDLTPTGEPIFHTDDWSAYDNPRRLSINDPQKGTVNIEIRAFKVKNDINYVIGQAYNHSLIYGEDPASNDKNNLAIMSFNTYLMSLESFGKITELYSHFTDKLDRVQKPGVKERTALMAGVIGSNYDVIVLSEVWEKEARQKLLRDLNQKGYKYATGIVGAGFEETYYKVLHERAKKEHFVAEIDIAKRIAVANDCLNNFTNKTLEQPYIIDLSSKDSDLEKGRDGVFSWDVAASLALKGRGFIGNGGVIIVSKWPIEVAREWIYGQGSGEDKFAKKGCVYARINKNGKHYHIFGTHLDTDSGIADKQLRWAKQFITDQQIPTNEPVIFTGDLNRTFLDANNRGILNEIKANIVEFRGSPITANDWSNALSLFGYSSTLDYILTINGYQQPSSGWVKVKKMISITPWSDEKYWNQWQPMRNVRDLSDHYAIVGHLVYPN
ncbi:MAG TPA: sphingomyelin phosphodiesterase [Candidatus Dependentiae bacterium]|nr:sphingomyelin phosphodiesterase [Candidatus Dependentiae bacterium]